MISLRRAEPTDEQILQCSFDNPGMRFEYVNGEIIVSPTTGISGVRQSALNLKLAAWAKTHGYRSFVSPADFPIDWDDVFTP